MISSTSSTQDLIQSLGIGEKFLFVDSVLEFDKTVSGRFQYKFRSDNPIFESHLLGNPVVPGVYLVEAMLQACALVVYSIPDLAGGPAFVTKVNVDFKKIVLPNENLICDVLITGTKRGKTSARIIGYVAKIEVCSAWVEYHSPHAIQINLNESKNIARRSYDTELKKNS